MNWFRSLFSRHDPHIPQALWEECVASLPFLSDLTPDELQGLKSLSERMLATQSMSGAAGLELRDDIAVRIAAQACLLVLELSLDLYDDMAGIVVYPGQFIVPMSEVDEAGVVHEWREPLAGEAMHTGGAVVLSWEDASEHSSTSAPFNVVIHEFAHKIDMGRGAADGCPPLIPRFHSGIDRRDWQRAFSDAFLDFCDRVDDFDARLPLDFDGDKEDHAALYDALAAELPMDPYAAHDPAEFFAVASEAFFVRPAPLAREYPQVYGLLRDYYRQDPFARQNRQG